MSNAVDECLLLLLRHARTRTPAFPFTNPFTHQLGQAGPQVLVQDQAVQAGGAVLGRERGRESAVRVEKRAAMRERERRAQCASSSVAPPAAPCPPRAWWQRVWCAAGGWGLLRVRCTRARAGGGVCLLVFFLSPRSRLCDRPAHFFFSPRRARHERRPGRHRRPARPHPPGQGDAQRGVHRPHAGHLWVRERREGRGPEGEKKGNVPALARPRPPKLISFSPFPQPTRRRLLLQRRQGLHRHPPPAARSGRVPGER